MNDFMLPLPGLSSVSGKSVVVKFDGGLLSSDGGVLALREVEQRLWVADRLAACLVDPRAPDQITHSLDVRVLLRMGRAMVDLYCELFAMVPKRITLDIDDTFDAVHGGQQLRLFNAHCDEYGFQPIVVFDGEGRFVTAVLRPAKRPSGKEIKPFLRRLLRAIRAHWPHTVHGDPLDHCGSLMLGVSENNQRRGIGSTLMATLLATAKLRANLRQVQLTVFTGNPNQEIAAANRGDPRRSSPDSQGSVA